MVLPLEAVIISIKSIANSWSMELSLDLSSDAKASTIKAFCLDLFSLANNHRIILLILFLHQLFLV